MGRKIEPKVQPAGESSPAEQLATLIPEVTITIGGGEVTIKQYGFFEELRIARQAEAFIGDLKALAMSSKGLRFDRIRRLFGVHEDVIVSISAKAADVDPQWVRELSDEDKRTFLTVWFGVQQRFFMDEVIEEIREDHRQVQAAAPSTGTMSLPASPPMDSATSTASADAPRIN